MRFQRVYQAVHFQPWLITPRAHETIARLLDSKLAGVEFKPKSDRPSEDFFGNPLPRMSIENGIATIPIYGVIGKGLGSFEKSCGAVGTEDVSADISKALETPSVRGIFLDINSPGGTVSGTPELADEISKAADKKPVMAWVEGEMCSAAYWLGSHATAIYGTKTSEVGSIGVYLPWIDRSDYYESMGFKVDLIKNKEGTYKGAGYPGTSLTPEQREEFQRGVDQIFSMFRNHITSVRRIPDEAMRGQTFMGDEAIQVGMLDSVTTRGQAMDDLLRLSKNSRPS